MDQIVKIQRAVAGEPSILIYNSDRSIQYETGQTPELLKLFKEDEFKVYYRYHFNGTQIALEDRAPDQKW